MSNTNKPASVGNITALVPQLPRNLIACVSNTSELEDFSMQTGTFTNAGAGWNTFTFPESFEEIPVVFCQCNEYNVEIKDITKNSFLYRLTVPVSSLGSSTKTFYTYSSVSSYYPYVYNVSSDYYTTPVTVLTGVNLDGGSGTTSEALEIGYFAISYEGE